MGQARASSGSLYRKRDFSGVTSDSQSLLGHPIQRYDATSDERLHSYPGGMNGLLTGDN
jgi:hypothetical protein